MPSEGRRIISIIIERLAKLILLDKTVNQSHWAHSIQHLAVSDQAAIFAVMVKPYSNIFIEFCRSVGLQVWDNKTTTLHNMNTKTTSLPVLLCIRFVSQQKRNIKYNTPEVRLSSTLHSEQFNETQSAPTVSLTFIQSVLHQPRVTVVQVSCFIELIYSCIDMTGALVWPLYNVIQFQQ